MVVDLHSPSHEISVNDYYPEVGEKYAADVGAPSEREQPFIDSPEPRTGSGFFGIQRAGRVALLPPQAGADHHQ